MMMMVTDSKETHKKRRRKKLKRPVHYNDGLSSQCARMSHFWGCQVKQTKKKEDEPTAFNVAISDDEKNNNEKSKISNIKQLKV